MVVMLPATGAMAAPGAEGAPAGTAAAVGGPMIPTGSVEATSDLKADAQFRTLFQSWKKLDSRVGGGIAIPSVQPVQKLNFT
nr:hypothetical protein [Tanacetum cinerariifolium]